MKVNVKKTRLMVVTEGFQIKKIYKPKNGKSNVAIILKHITIFESILKWKSLKNCRILFRAFLKYFSNGTNQPNLIMVNYCTLELPDPLATTCEVTKLLPKLAACLSSVTSRSTHTVINPA